MQIATSEGEIVTDGPAVLGILTERDLLRASAAHTDPLVEPVRKWMTPDPDVVALDEEVGAAWAGLSRHHYRHLPVVDGGSLVGVVSIRDLVSVAQIRPTDEAGIDVPAGLEGVVVAQRALPSGLEHLLPALAGAGSPLDSLRSGISMLGAELGWRPTLDIGPSELRSQALRLCAGVPTLLAAAHRLRHGEEPVPPRDDLSQAANYLWMLTGVEAPPEHVRAVEQYMVLTIDHGFNASTFAARVIASTGADLAAALTGAVGALSGPLHGGAPSRALAMLDAIGTPDRAEEWIRRSVAEGDRIMGFGHRVYKTDDPRSVFLRDVAKGLGGPLVDFAEQVERTTVDVLAELKPGRRLYTNVEFFAGVVMQTCGIPREMFTPTFAVGRTIGWAAHVMEQAADNRLIRPAARYVGPTPPVPVPAPAG